MYERLINPVQLVIRILLGDGARPSAGVRTLGVISLARAEFQIVELDGLGLGSELRFRMSKGMVEQRVRSRVTRIGGVSCQASKIALINL